MFDSLLTCQKIIRLLIWSPLRFHHKLHGQRKSSNSTQFSKKKKSQNWAQNTVSEPPGICSGLNFSRLTSVISICVQINVPAKQNKHSSFNLFVFFCFIRGMITAIISSSLSSTTTSSTMPSIWMPESVWRDYGRQPLCLPVSNNIRLHIWKSH